MPSGRIIRAGHPSHIPPRLSRRSRWLLGGAAGLLFAMAYAPFIAPPVKPVGPPGVTAVDMSQFWNPVDTAAADLFNGPWGEAYAPDPESTYVFVEAKIKGASPGMTVEDASGRAWSVKQGREASVEPTLSRVLSALGYHQPPVFFLRSFVLSRDGRIARAEGGRFRPKIPGFREAGDWSWQQNPFVGTPPYQGLLVVLLLFNSSDLKNDNNSIYELAEPRESASRWFVVRDIGAALGETARIDPPRGNPDLFEQAPFITGVRDGFVEFAYEGWHQELVRRRITPADVAWACTRLAQLSDRQWGDAFRAGGYDPNTADRFIRRIKLKIAEGRRLELSE
jgi:hypothetical protein